MHTFHFYYKIIPIASEVVLLSAVCGRADGIAQCRQLTGAIDRPHLVGIGGIASTRAVALSAGKLIPFEFT